MTPFKFISVALPSGASLASAPAAYLMGAANIFDETDVKSRQHEENQSKGQEIPGRKEYKVTTNRRFMPAEMGSCMGFRTGLRSYADAIFRVVQTEEEMSIFKKSDDDEQPDVASPPKLGQARPIRPKNVSVIGPTLVFKGELSADEDLIIEGRIEGTIAHHKKHLTVGKEGRVSADIHASSVIVEGQLVGDIHSEGIVSLAKGADVTGNIFCGRLVMQDGAKFNGKIEMVERPEVKEVPKEPVKTKTVRADKAKSVEGRCASPMSP